MPRKTKKQKIIAAYRKKLQLLKNRQEIHIPSKQIITERTPLLTPIKSVLVVPVGAQDQPVSQQTGYDMRLKTRTLADLKKTLIIAVLVLAFEFLIFYVNLKGYLITF